MMPRTEPFSDRAREQKQARQAAGLWRQRQLIEPLNSRQIRVDDQVYLQFASNDYLGLAFLGEPQLAQGAAASPLVTGYHPVHQQLEQHLCELTGYEAALLFSSGFAANSAPLGLLQQGDRILADKLAHASMIMAAQASVGTLRRFPHNDMAILEQWLAQSDCATLVASESVFSMDGDQAPIIDIVSLCQQYGALSWLDDAHGFAVIAAAGVAEIAQPDLLTVTFGKAIGASGAALLGSQVLIEAILQSAHHYIYSTAISVDQARHILQQLERAQDTEARVALTENIRYFQQQAAQKNLQILPSSSPIQALLAGSSHAALTLSEQLRAQGIWCPAIRPPTVPQGRSRLRIVLNAAHTREDIDRLLAALEASG